MVALPIFGILYIVIPGLFAFVFGEEWRVAGEYSRILIPYLFMNFLISPISSIPIILNKQKEIFFISLIGNSMYILVFILFHKYQIKEVLLILSVTQVVFYIYVVYWYYKIIRENRYE